MLDFFSPGPGLHDHEHVNWINFNDFIHFLQRQNDAAVNRHRAASEAGPGAARHNGNQLAVGQLHHSSSLFGSFREYDDLRHVMIARFGHFIMAVGLHPIGVSDDVLIAEDGAQFRKNRRGYRVVRNHL